MIGFILILTEQNRIVESDDERTLVIKKKLKHRAGATLWYDKMTIINHNNFHNNFRIIPFL